MICTSYHHQWSSSTLSMGGSRRGQNGQFTWTREQWTTHESHPLGNKRIALQWWVSPQGLCRNHLMHVPLCIGTAIHSLPQVSITASVRRLFATSSYCLSCYILVCIHYCSILLYIYIHLLLNPKCWVTLHMPQHRKVIPWQVVKIHNQNTVK